MLDLDYSDSDSSDSEQNTDVPAATSGLSVLLPKPKSRKHKNPTADKDAPKRIVVNLPKFEKEDEDGQPVKRARTGGMSGLSAMLPAPKRSGAAKREGDSIAIGIVTHEPAGDGRMGGNAAKRMKPEVEATSARNTAFLPQSVARKPIQPMSSFKKKGAGAIGKAKRVESVRPKVSLFGLATTAASTARPKATSSISAGEYKPIMLEAARPVPEPTGDTGYLHGEPGFATGIAIGAQQDSYAADTNVAQGPQDLGSLVREVGLDENAMRQLYGRHRPDKEPIKFTTFSVDEEYKQNEIDRESGVAPEVKPVRVVAPGRHQLQSLLNVAQSQRGALEESFARGKSNRKEASSRYGW